MPRSKRTIACDITPAVKKAVWERDGGQCIICGSPYAHSNSHFIRRSRGGLGIEQNITTMCQSCHRVYDSGRQDNTDPFYLKIRDYLKSQYEIWNEEMLYYSKYNF